MTKKKTTDINPERSEKDRLFKKYSSESTAVRTASIAMITAAAFAVFSLIALAASLNANLRAEYQDKEIEKLNANLDVYRVRYANWVALMKTKGIELPEEE